MATWSDVQREIRSTFVLDQDHEHEFAFTLPVRGNAARRQRVMVRHYSALNDEMVELRSAYAKAEEVDPSEALEENLSLPLGAIAKHGRFLVLVHRVALRHTSVEGVIAAANQIAQVADWLESRHGGDRF